MRKRSLVEGSSLREAQTAKLQFGMQDKIAGADWKSGAAPNGATIRPVGDGLSARRAPGMNGAKISKIWGSLLPRRGYSILAILAQG
jgi:hypothetical protein